MLALSSASSLCVLSGSCLHDARRSSVVAARLKWVGPVPVPIPPAVDALDRGDAVIMLPGIATEAECAALSSACVAAADVQQQMRHATGMDSTPGLVRLQFPAHATAEPQEAATLPPHPLARGEPRQRRRAPPPQQ